MSMRELWINGELIDLGGAAVTLSWKSNIFTSPDKIQGSMSYTVTVPRTERNERALRMTAEIGAVESAGMVRKYHPCRYARDGVTLFEGRAVVQETGAASVGIVLYWNMNAAIAMLSNEGWSLKDLYEGWTQFLWYKGIPVPDYSPDEAAPIAWADYGLQFASVTGDLMGVHGTWHPAVAAWYILSHINSKLGLPDNMEALKGYFSGLYVPDLTEEDTPARIEGATLRAKGTGGLYERVALKFDVEPYDEWYIKYGQLDHYTGFRVVNTVNGEVTTDDKEVADIVTGLVVSGAFVIQLLDGYTGIESFNVIMFQSPTASSVTLATLGRAEATGVAGVYTLAFEGVEVDLSEAKPGYDIFIAPDVSGVSGAVVTPESTLEIVPVVSRMPMPHKSLAEAFWYNYIYNLPDIKCLDFIKALCTMTGTYVKPKGDALDFGFYKDISTDGAADWSERLLWYEERKMSFKWGDMARVNYFRYKGKDNGWMNVDGSMEVDDITLAASKDYASVPFMYPDGDKIPIYTFDIEESNGYQLEEAGPYLLKAVPVRVAEGTAPADVVGDNKFGLTGRGLEMWNILIAHYAEFRRWVARPVVIEAKLRLTALDLRDLDMERLYYFRQIGRHFFLLELTTGSGSVCSAKFLEYKA